MDELEGRRPLHLVVQAREGLVDGLEGTPPFQVVAVEGEVQHTCDMSHDLWCKQSET